MIYHHLPKTLTLKSLDVINIGNNKINAVIPMISKTGGGRIKIPLKNVLTPRSKK